MIVNSTRRDKRKKAVDELLYVPLRELQSPQAKQYLERIVFDRYCPVSVIGIRGKAGLFLLYSNLDQMEGPRSTGSGMIALDENSPFPYTHSSSSARRFPTGMQNTRGPLIIYAGK